MNPPVVKILAHDMKVKDELSLADDRILDSSKLKALTLSQASSGFYVCTTSLLKTLWEREKLLVTSNFSFSQSVFYWFRELSAIFFKFEIVICKLFQFRKV